MSYQLKCEWSIRTIHYKLFGFKTCLMYVALTNSQKFHVLKHYKVFINIKTFVLTCNMLISDKLKCSTMYSLIYIYNLFFYYKFFMKSFWHWI